MDTKITNDESITAPRKRTLIIIGAFFAIVAAWFITSIVTKNSLYHQ